jgi:hypothetical protein
VPAWASRASLLVESDHKNSDRDTVHRVTSKTCFFIAPIGEADTLIRRRSDQVLKHIVRGALEPMGYVVARADEVHDSGLITNQIIERVIGADMVVADLAGSKCQRVLRASSAPCST